MHSVSPRRRLSLPTRLHGRLCAALLIAAWLWPAPGMARPMTPEDVARIEHVGQIAVSPDGTRIAHTTIRLPDITRGGRNGPARAQLHISWGPGQARAFLPADVDVADIAFSPDGRLLAFIWAGEKDAKDAKDAVWAIPVDGGGHRKLGEVAGAHVEGFAFAPDGRQLYMLATAEPGARRRQERDAGFDAEVFEEEWAFHRLFVAQLGDAMDAAPRQITVPGHVTAIQIAPDGRTAVLESAATPSVDDSYVSKRAVIFDLATGTSRAIATTGKLGKVALSPDGRTLALTAGEDQHDPAPTTLMLADMATGALRSLNAGAAEAAMDIGWLADGRLAAVIHKGAQGGLRIYDAAGAVVSDTATAPIVPQAIATGGKVIAVRGDAPDFPPELLVLHQGALRRWTRHNPWLADIDMGRQRVMTYTARDGQRIEGILIEPVGGVKPARGRLGVPLILDVHGGPETHETNGWTTAYNGPGQVAAGRGYAVFLPNYRGSTGYGVAFAKQHQFDAAGKEFDDLVDARAALVAQGLADPARVGITGGSYGGYASAWGATAQSQYFAAAVMFVGISNQISKFGTTEIPREMQLVHERQYPWEDWQKALDRSPISHAGKARTPLLILHGKGDSRVDPGQSLELYRHIRLRTQTPVRLVLYPGEGHGNRKAAARLDYHLRMLEWFDRYLGGAGAADGQLPAPPPPRPAIPGLPTGG